MKSFEVKSLVAVTSIGNLGFAKNACGSWTGQVANGNSIKIDLSCPTELILTNLNHFGIRAKNEKENKKCDQLKASDSNVWDFSF